ncbi:HAMP domain-containing sensor histidine kinase [Salinisphaera sp. T31B1]|uniref:HAMP domain-containing sensor histidine kinase n=1 Tax=Salinisphaera sp. T31B1 TaxID=727963 RepID=UPI00333FC1EC
MLDLKTILLLEAFMATLQGIAWIFIWRAWRHLYELTYIAVGFIALAAALLMILAGGREPPGWYIVVDNTLIKLALVLMAYGLARFLGQPRHAWLGISMMSLQIVFWTVTVAVIPENVALRVHASTVFTIVIMGFMILTLARDRVQPAALRWVMIGVLFEYICASVLRSAIEVLYVPDAASMDSIMDQRNAWYFFQGTLFLITYFGCLFFMVGARLSADLRSKNDALSAELVERRRLENRLAASLDSEKKFLDEQYQFIRLISHEFRTPLAIIQRSAEMIPMLVAATDHGVQSRVDQIREAIGRLTTLLDRFLAADRKDGAVIQPKRLPPVQLLEALRRHLDTTGQRRRVVIEQAPEAPPIEGDLDMLLTVLINLVDNALKYSPADRDVTIRTRCCRQALQIQVIDQGIGVPPGEQGRIGRRFFRASNASATAGTGLGLYNTKRLLALHDGHLDFDAPLGGPTTATITLPPATATSAHTGQVETS